MEQGGGSLYGTPPPESTAAVDILRPAEAAAPISVRPPPAANLDEPVDSGSFPAGVERGAAASGGNRWPRQETIALIEIRSGMDAAFREATLKAPLWEYVSRRLGEQGYSRSAKKCKEKFENVHKYYKRTKDGRAARHDGKAYCFFDQLEALHGSASDFPLTTTTTTTTVTPTTTVPVQPGISFTSDTPSYSPSESEEEEGRKRKRRTSSAAALFKGMTREVVERLDKMQRRFLEAMDNREQERSAREDAWRRQESARLALEYDLLARERVAAASRDAAILAFLQKIAGDGTTAANHPPPSETAVTVVPPEAGPSPSSLSSRWPKAEVHALIKIRSGMEGRYQEGGPKGALWDDVSAEMGRLGHSRSTKRCKEKWENINKYYKRVKESSSKRRPEDAKTCPYFHQLDALYRRKGFVNTAAVISTPDAQEPVSNPDPNSTVDRMETIESAETGNNNDPGDAASCFEEETSGSAAPVKPEGVVKGMIQQQACQLKAAEDKCDKRKEPESDGLEDDSDDENDDDGSDERMQYRVQFQRVDANGGGATTTTAGSLVGIENHGS